MKSEDLVEKACLCLIDGRHPDGITSNEKSHYRRKGTLREGV